MQIKNRQQTLAVLAIVVVGLLALERLVITPLARGWKERSHRIADLKQSVSEGAQLLERERAIRSHWESMRTNTLPNNVSAAENEVYKGFDRWSRASGISIGSITAQDKRNSDEYMTVECRVDGFGSLPALTRFLYEMEKDSLALKVESVDLTARDNSGQQLSLALQVSGLMLNPPRQP
jgi:Type II secretion system (T2SS), protein M subtype b